MRKFLLLSFLFLLCSSAANAEWTVNKSGITDDDVFLFQDTSASAGQKTGYISGTLLKDYVLSDVIDFSATSPLSFNSTTGVLSLTPWSSQSALETWLGWTFSGSGGGIIVSSTLPTVAGSAALNDSTHVLTVSSDTGYTQFTGSFTAWDTTPTAFGFGAITDAVAGQEYCWTTPVTVAGINRAATVASTADSYKINGYASTATSIDLGNTFTPCMIASSTAGATVSGNMTIGGVDGDPAFSVTTEASASTPIVSQLLSSSNAPAGYHIAQSFTMVGSTISAVKVWFGVANGETFDLRIATSRYGVEVATVTGLTAATSADGVSAAFNLVGLTPGATYYIHVYEPTGIVRLSRQDADVYAGGMYYSGPNEASYDASTEVASVELKFEVYP